MNKLRDNLIARLNSDPTILCKEIKSKVKNYTDLILDEHKSKYLESSKNIDKKYQPIYEREKLDADELYDISKEKARKLLDQLKLDTRKDLDELKIKFESELEELKSDNKKKLKELKAKGEAELNEAKKAHLNAEEEVKESLTSKADEDKKSKISAIAKEAEFKLESLIKANKVAIKKLNEEYINDSEKLQSDQEIHIAAFKKKCDDILKRIEEKSADRLATLKTKYNAKVKDFKEENAKQIKDSIDETKEEINKIEANYQENKLARKEKAASKFAKKIQKVKENLELKNQKLIAQEEASIKKATADKLKELKQKYAKKMYEAKNESIENNSNLDEIDELKELISELKNKLRESLSTVAIKSANEAYMNALFKSYLDKIYANLKEPAKMSQSAESYRSEIRKIDEIVEFLSGFDNLSESMSDLVDSQLKKLENRKSELVSFMKSHGDSLLSLIHNKKFIGKPQRIKSNEVKLKVNVVVIDKPVIKVKTFIKK